MKVVEGRMNNINKNIKGQKEDDRKLVLKNISPANKAESTLSEKCDIIVCEDYLQKHCSCWYKVLGISFTGTDTKKGERLVWKYYHLRG